MKLAVCVIVALLPSPAWAFECPFGEEGRLVPIRWSAEQDTFATNVRIGVQSTFDKPIRMVDAGVWFVDGLGRTLLEPGMAVDPDLQIGASGANISSMRYLGAERLVGARVEDFTPHICTRVVLFSDGSKVEF